MQLVIEISDTLKRIADNEDAKTFSHIVWQALLMDAIKNGQTLPKGHGDLIDRNELRCERADFDTYNDYCIMFDEIDNAPAIIEADGGNRNG